MPSLTLRSLPSLPGTVLVLLALAPSAPAAAQGYRGVEPYGPAYDGGYGAYGYAGDLVRGTYIGAPLTRTPSTLDIVPTPWSYGTYGVPTVSGIPPSPVAQPTITRINVPGPRAARWAEPDRAAGARVIEVRVPHR